MLKNSQISKNFNPNEEILKHFMRSKERAALRKLLDLQQLHTFSVYWSEFNYARSHVNADNEVTSDRSEILSRSEISNRFELTSGLM